MSRPLAGHNQNQIWQPPWVRTEQPQLRSCPTPSVFHPTHTSHKDFLLIIRNGHTDSTFFTILYIFVKVHFNPSILRGRRGLKLIMNALLWHHKLCCVQNVISHQFIKTRSHLHRITIVTFKNLSIAMKPRSPQHSTYGNKLLPRHIIMVLEKKSLKEDRGALTSKR